MGLEFNLFEKGSNSVVLLGLLGTGEASPDSMINVSEDAILIPENYQDVAKFRRIQVSGELSAFNVDRNYFYQTTEVVANRYLLTPFAIFDEEQTTNPVQVEPLFYKYELKFDHMSSSSNPGGNLFLLDKDGNIVSRVYYSLFVESSYRIPTQQDISIGAFILGTSQVDSAIARSALGENIWGEIYGTTSTREHFLWERENSETKRPRWYEQENFTNEISGVWSRIDDGRYTREAFMSFYIDRDGFWGQAIDADSKVIYTARNGSNYRRGPAISGTFANIQTIGDLISEKYLDGSNLFLPDVPLRITLLLPEFLVHQDEQTYWVQYNKIVRFPLSGEMIEEYTPNFREIINPVLLMRENKEYLFNYTTGRVEIQAAFEARFGKLDNYYFKKNKDHRIKITSPLGNSREAWFLEITKGDFKVGSNVYSTHRYVDSLAKAKDWFSGVSANTENNLYLGISVKERAAVIDQRTIRVKHTPLYFWSGPRSTSVKDGDYGYFPVEDDSAGYDTGEFAGADNPWPRYIPASLLDWHFRSEYSFFPSAYNAIPDYSHGISIYKNGNRMSNANIDTWDFWNGIIVFKDPIHADDIIEVTYLFEHNKAPLGFLNLNPIYSEKIYEPTSPTFSSFT